MDREGEGLLLPCPWCLEQPRLSPRVHSLGEAVECENEKCPVRPSSHSMRDGEAIRYWNTRTQPPASEELVTDAVERVARAMEEADTSGENRLPWQDYEHMARAAIAALQAQSAADVEKH